MHKIYKILFLVVIAVTTKTNSSAQVPKDSSGGSKNIPDSQVVSDTIPILQNPAVTQSKDSVPVSVNHVASDTIPIVQNPAVTQSKDSVPVSVNHVASDTIPIVQNTAVTQSKDSVPVSVNVELENIFDAKSPKEYILSDIKVTGTKSFDPNLIISISGLAKGDKVMIPGGDNFSKAITNLWKQSLVSDVQVYFTNLVGNKLSIEININRQTEPYQL